MLSYTATLHSAPGQSAKPWSTAATHVHSPPRERSSFPAASQHQLWPVFQQAPGFLTLSPRPARLPDSVPPGYVNWASHLTSLSLSFPHL